MTVNGNAAIFRQTDEYYTVTYSGAVMRQAVSSYSVKSSAEEKTDVIDVFIQGTSADVRKGDFIVFGDIPDDLSEAAETAHTVVSVTVCDYGAADMRHIELKAV